MASDDGPAAAPTAAPRTRRATRVAPVWATADRAANTVTALSDTSQTRRAPSMSASFPADGPKMA